MAPRKGISNHAGKHHSVESKKKQSESHKNMSAETRKLMSIAKIGNKNRHGYIASTETCSKLSAKSTNNKNCLGRVVSKETRIKNSIATLKAIENGFIPQNNIMNTKHGEVYGKEYQSGYEKKYILSCNPEELKILNSHPEKVWTPFGYYFPDFEFPDRYIEVKSKWTFLTMPEKQKTKIEWINNNFKTIEIKVL